MEVMVREIMSQSVSTAEGVHWIRTLVELDVHYHTQAPQELLQ